MVLTSRLPETEALAEDQLTAWVPDPAGLVDVSGHLAADAPSASHIARWLNVPRPNGSTMCVPVLHPAAHAALHQAVEVLRDPLDDVLSSGVCGYRRGAQADGTYRSEFLRFSQLVTEAATSCEAVVFADIKQFFDSVSLADAAGAAGRLVGDATAAPLRALAEEWGRGGVDNLPAGYADARMLANLVLHEAEVSFPCEFARWVDDYRVFIRSGSGCGAETALDTLEQRLGGLGLVLNRPKTRVVTASLAADESRNSLASVYHPDRDPGDVVRKKLRAVWHSAAQDPVAHRRALRFALPRLALERDPIAIDYAVRGLADTPWEAPRLVAYLHAFQDEERIVAAVDRSLSSAARARNVWMLCRLGPLACRTGVSSSTAAGLSDAMPALATSPAWGSALRVLSAGGHRAHASAHATPRANDARTAIVALRDLGLPIHPALAAVEPITVAALDGDVAPLPPVDSLL